MSKTVLLATEKAFAAEAVRKIEAVTKSAGYELQKLENYNSKDDLLKAITSADAMIIRSDIVDAAVVDKASNLKIVVRAGAGFDNIDLSACTAKRIVAQNTPGQNANAVAELVFGMMLTSARNNYDGTSGFELVNREIAFYGFGAVARAVHKIAVGMGMKCFAYDPYVPEEKIAEAGATPVKTIPELFDHQYVSLHVPLTPETKASINKALLSRLPKNGCLINTARHEVVHEADIMQMFKDRPDFCYLSDVAPKNAEEIKKLLGDKYMKRAIFTSKKMGAQTLEANNNAGVAAANQIVAFFEQGETRFQLNPFPPEPPTKRARTGLNGANSSISSRAESDEKLLHDKTSEQQPETPEQQQVDRILVIDFGSQVSHLICRRVREANVYCEMRSCLLSASDVMSFAPTGVILSGGPHSVYDKEGPHLKSEVWNLLETRKVPVLGICYGLQEMCHTLGGKVEPGVKREFGHAELSVKDSALFKEIAKDVAVWMSHGDKVTQLPPGFTAIASTSNCPYAAVENSQRLMWGVQFHPEVTHTPCGAQIIKNFVRDICGCKGAWTMADFAKRQAESILAKLGDKYCVGAVSGGVDSSVAASLVHNAVGSRFRPFLVDTGLLRKDEAKLVKARLEKHVPGMKLKVIDASQKFYAALSGVTEPEQKRKIIGRLFIECFEQAVKEMELPHEKCMLLQGTLYPDVIESTSFRGPSTVIKSHHNVGGLPAHMKMELLEPMRLLFKDEVRALGRELGLPEESVMRHPFPGPGLGIRIIGEANKENASTLMHADDIYIQELRKNGHYEKIGQAFAVLLPTVKSVGVMGDHRTYENVCVLRAVTSTDFMTADWYDLPKDVLAKISNRIINEVKGINRVCYDVSSKPPATIEWE